MNEIIKSQYLHWMDKAKADHDLIKELQEIAKQEEKIEDAFYRNLTFGTGGLRGVIGVGTNRMNIYTVGKASQGLADYVIKYFDHRQCAVAVSYDSRIKSDLFAKTAAGVFAANGIQVFIYPELMPTPCLSYAVRELRCAAGIMVTASHNSSEYNGFKVYGADGCQITTVATEEILAKIEKLDTFDDVQTMAFETGIETGLIEYISERVYTSFVEAVKKQSVLDENTSINKNVAIIYTPLNGTGLKPVLRTLKESGYTNITVVKEQEQPNGDFPTCPYPNPEIKGAMALGMEYARKSKADLLLATDPDCDRVGIAVKSEDGEYVLLSANETGVLLLDFICSQRQLQGRMPADPVFIKTIATSDMAERIAAQYGVRTVNVLTGFKFIGEQIGLLEEKGNDASFIFGFEESYGYLGGSYVRDKDAVGGAFLISEMFAYYQTQGISLLVKLEELYCLYGYQLNTQHSFDFKGAVGFKIMQEIMSVFRKGLTVIGDKDVVKCLDFGQGLDGLPPSDVIKYILKDDCFVIVRPSGTEPKLKIYVSVCAGSREAAGVSEARIIETLRELLPVEC